MPSASTDLLEIRLYGLNISITTDALGEFLGKGVRVRGILLHPPDKGAFQWAQVWVKTEAEVLNLMGLREVLAANGITISRFGKAATVTPPQTSWDMISQLSRNPGQSSPGGLNLSSLSPSPGNLFGNSYESASSLPRNLYILNLPLDLTQIEFKDLFTTYGMVEHSILLSQLDGIGRRRGFVLMATHREALEVMHQMHGRWIDGFKLDVSWALVQREAKNMPNSTLPNRVVHPPAIPTRREPSAECAVILDNLDAKFFPDPDTISSIFRSFGSIHRVVKLAESPLSVLIQFDHVSSAKALINANGLRLGERVLSTRGFGAAIAPEVMRNNFDPFSDITNSNYFDLSPQAQGKLQPQRSATPTLFNSPSTRLNAKSQPFVPSFKSENDSNRKFPVTPVKSGGGFLDRADLSMSMLSVDSGSPDKSTSSIGHSAGNRSVKSQRSDTTVVGDE